MKPKNLVIIGILLLIMIQLVSPYTIQGEEDEKKELWSKKQLCTFIKGCLSEDFCYPFGYRKGTNYCGIDEQLQEYNIERTKFVPQLLNGKFCENDFECKSNLCLDNFCAKEDYYITNITKEINELEKINEELEKKIITLEEKINSSKNEEKQNSSNTSTSPITGNTISNNKSYSKNIFTKLWKRIWRK